MGQTTTLLIQRQHSTPLCPVHNLKKFLAIRPCTTTNHSLFIHSNTKPLTRFQFNAVLQKAIQSAGIGGHFGTHSFRIGRATDLALQGYSDQQIQTFGRWKSLAFQKYIRMYTSNQLALILVQVRLHSSVLLSYPTWAGQLAANIEDGKNLTCLPTSIGMGNGGCSGNS